MSYVFYNLGNSMVAAYDGQVAEEGQVIFGYCPSEDELDAAFPGRAEDRHEKHLALLASDARSSRDALLVVYDKGIQMVRRELETSPLDPAYEAKLIAKRSELHSYARLLQAIPEQSGFPEEIEWPEIPTEELE